MTATALGLIEFLNVAKSPYHAAAVVALRLQQSGYIELDERSPWPIEPGLKAFVRRAGGSLVAFHVGTKAPSTAGYLMIGAHTDSPNLRVKPSYELRSNKSFGLSVEPYGGLLLHSWLDRPLSVAGRIVTGRGEAVMVTIDQPIVTIPSLAIHLQREVNQQGLILNPQQHLRPIMGQAFDDQAGHPFSALLIEALSSSLNRAVGPKDLEQSAFDLCLLDATNSSFLGHNNEYVASGRLDNLVSAYAGLEALLEVQDHRDITRVFVLYDHEEVGSRSYAGAQSTLLGDVLTRITNCLTLRDSEAHFRAMASSMLLSADMAHAIHPNFADKHDDLHRPILGQGPVLKSNAGQSYATDAVSAAAIYAAATRANLELQRFVTRSDMPCGSTIGPLAAARQGVRTVDVGNPMLAMHSCRELCASIDVAPYARLMSEWFKTEDIHCPSH